MEGTASHSQRRGSSSGNTLKTSLQNASPFLSVLIPSIHICFSKNSLLINARGFVIRTHIIHILLREIKEM